MNLKLDSIEKEAKLCRKAFNGVKIGTFVLHCHHEILGERLNEEAENRIAYILNSKAQHEKALRLHLFRPVSTAKLRLLGKKYSGIKQAYAARKQAYAAWKQAYAAWKQADVARERAEAARKRADAELAILVHPHVCKNCPWDGETIFGARNA